MKNYYLKIIILTICNHLNQRKIIMEILTQISFVENILDKFFKPKHLSYNNEPLNFYLNHYQEIIHKQFSINNKHNQLLIGSIYQHFNRSDNCIVYLHGFGSTQYEALNILNIITEEFDLCSFDFSGTGRSQGTFITYGNKQQQDVDAIIHYLRKLQYKKFVLWGRSMGATTSLLYCSIDQSPDIVLQILDSPFYKFQDVVIELINKKYSLPNIALNTLLKITKKYCQQFQYNPFDVDSSEIQFCRTPTLFIYSQNDTVISCANTQKIIKHCRLKYEKIQIAEDHNRQRKYSTLENIYNIILKYIKISDNRSSLTSISSRKSLKKGIDLTSNIKLLRNGLWVSSRFKIQNFIKRGQRRNYCGISTSLSTKNFRKSTGKILSSDRYL